MKSFEDVRAAISAIETPVYNTPESGPFLLLVGAAYSIACDIAVEKHRVLEDKSRDMWRAVQGAISSGNPLKVSEAWGRTYFLTNAIIRIAHAVEKIEKLAGDQSSHAHHHDGEVESVNRCFMEYQEDRKIGNALECCIAECNHLKHGALDPQPEKAEWYRVIATEGLILATDFYGRRSQHFS